MGDNNIFERFESIQKDNGSGRTDVWTEAWRLITDQGIFTYFVGNGFNTVVHNSRYVLSAHNDYLEAWFDFGLIGMLLYIISLCLLFKDIFECLKTKKEYAPAMSVLGALIIVLTMISHIAIYYWFNVIVLCIAYLKDVTIEKEDNLQKKKKIMSENKVNNRIISNVFWALVGKITSLVSALLVGILVARYLGPTQYGVMNYAISFVTLFLVIATFGFENIEIREEAKANNLKDTILGTVFVLRLLLSLVTIVIISAVAYINETDLYTYGIIMIYAITVILTPFDVIRNYFTSLVQNEYIVKVGIFRTVLSGTIKIVLLLVHASLLWFVISLVFDACVLAQGYCYVYKKKIGSMRSWHFDKVWARYLLRQSFPLLLSGVAATVFLQIDQIMIGNMIDKTSVGYFSVASKFVEVLLYVPTILIQTVSPLLVKERKYDLDSYRKKHKCL